ncbi:dihydroorotase [Pseudoalteromonas shioyasakiensis]|nr:dihydroorotase [Pseudoalteromonas shioyasakiensis]
MAIIIKHACVVNEGQRALNDVRIVGDRIAEIASDISAKANDEVIDASGLLLLPGMIDDQVHFREPGLIHKGTIASESAAAVAGGITSFMEMPNVSPSTTTAKALADKYAIAAQTSAANYAFYFGATPDNLDEIKALDAKNVCGVKVFMGASTGDLLVEHPHALEAIFRESPVLIATHCEQGEVIQQNQRRLAKRYGELRIEHHPFIRDELACYASSSYAVSLAKRYGSQLHVLHLTTAKELELFSNAPIEQKHITAEACVHHLWFNQDDYANYGNQIKCNPAIKSEQDRQALLSAVRDGRIDIIATDHAPHTWQEKQLQYSAAPAGLPLVEHALLSLLEQVKRGALSLEQVVEKTAHNVAKRFAIEERGFIREGYFADLVLVDPNAEKHVEHTNTHYLCQWTPFNGTTFSHRITHTFVNGECVFDGQQVTPHKKAAKALTFNR